MPDVQPVDPERDRPIESASPTARPWDEPPFDIEVSAAGTTVRGRIEGLWNTIPWSTPIRVYDAEAYERKLRKVEDRRRAYELERRHPFRTQPSVEPFAVQAHPDDEGCFEIDVSQLIARTWDGFRVRTLRVDADDPHYTPAAAEIELPDDPLTLGGEEVVLEVSPTAVLTGVVTGASGPAVGVSVVAVCDSPFEDRKEPLGQTSTDTEGRYWLRASYTGTVRVVAFGPARPDVQVSFANERTVTQVAALRVGGGVEIHGTVDGPSGLQVQCRRLTDSGKSETVAGREILLEDSRWVYRSTAVRAGSDGFRFTGLSPGPHEVSLFQLDGIQLGGPGARVEVEAPASGVVVPAEVIPVTIRSEPIRCTPASLRVTCGTQSFQTKLRPDARMYLTPGAVYQLQVDGDRTFPMSHSVQVPDDVDRFQHDLELQPLEHGELQLELLTPRGIELGLVACRLEPVERSSETEPVWRGAAPLALGRLRFEAVEPGEYDIRLSFRSSYLLPHQTTARVDPGTKATQRVALSAGGRVQVWDGEARVHGDWTWDLWNADGTRVDQYELSRLLSHNGVEPNGVLPPGSYWFILRSDDDRFPKRIGVRAGHTTHVYVDRDEHGWDVRMECEEG